MMSPSVPFDRSKQPPPLPLQLNWPTTARIAARCPSISPQSLPFVSLPNGAATWSPSAKSAVISVVSPPVMAPMAARFFLSITCQSGRESVSSSTSSSTGNISTHDAEDSDPEAAAVVEVAQRALKEWWWQETPPLLVP